MKLKLIISKKLDEIKINVKGTLYKKICPNESYFLEYASLPGIEDKEMGKIAHDLGYKVGDAVELEITAKRKN